MGRRDPGVYTSFLRNPSSFVDRFVRAYRNDETADAGEAVLPDGDVRKRADGHEDGNTDGNSAQSSRHRAHVGDDAYSAKRPSLASKLTSNISASVAGSLASNGRRYIGETSRLQAIDGVGAQKVASHRGSSTYGHIPSMGTVIDGQSLRFSAEKIIGNGSFGVVFQASVIETGETVAIKKVLQDRRFKNRELHIMRQLAKEPHPNVIALKHCFYSSEKEGTKSAQSRRGQDKKERSNETGTSASSNVYLNLVLEYMPETVYSVARRWQKSKTLMPISHVRVYLYQLCRALGQIHALGICHRDVKPQNLLLDPETQRVKLIDFGSAKVLMPGEPNVSYICSRYYRAPELIFGSTEYTTAVDTWSTGCVFAELLLGSPLFPGDSGVDQLVEIIKVLGTPSREDIRGMNASYTDFKFPQIRGHDWNTVFRSRTPPQAIECVSSFLAYAPSQRTQPLRAISQSFFDDLRIPGATLDDGRPLPQLFNFTKLEVASFPEIINLRSCNGKVDSSDSVQNTNAMDVV